MDYEKKYKETLEKVKIWQNHLYEVGDKDYADELYYIFPELKESEDERMLREIKRYIKEQGNKSTGLPNGTAAVADMLAWLEKQGDKSVNIDIESMVSSYKQRLKSQGGIENSPLVNMCLTAFRRGVENTLEELNLKKLEKKGEQKPSEWHREDEQNLNACLGYIPDEFLRRWLTDIIHVKYDKLADKVEPKFKVGDWVVLSTSDGKKVVQIDSIEHFKSGEPMYITSEGRWFGNGTKARLLTDKDVETITLPESKIIVKQKPTWSEEDEKRIKNIISVLDWDGAAGKKGNPYQNEIDWLYSLKNRVQPKQELSEEDEDMIRYIGNAITCKESAKYLEEKGIDMIKAHRWLESFKPQLKQEWSEEDETVLNNLIYALANDRIGNDRDEYISYLKSIKERVRPQKQVWGEEDEYILLHTINDLKFLKDTISIDPNYAVNIIDIEREIDWLKSLKDRYTWKPSDEQMKALHDLNLTGNISYAGQGQELINLYNNLNKLKA